MELRASAFTERSGVGSRFSKRKGNCTSAGVDRRIQSLLRTRSRAARLGCDP